MNMGGFDMGGLIPRRQNIKEKIKDGGVSE